MSYWGQIKSGKFHGKGFVVQQIGELSDNQIGTYGGHFKNGYKTGFGREEFLDNEEMKKIYFG